MDRHDIHSEDSIAKLFKSEHDRQIRYTAARWRSPIPDAPGPWVPFFVWVAVLVGVTLLVYLTWPLLVGVE